MTKIGLIGFLLLFYQQTHAIYCRLATTGKRSEQVQIFHGSLPVPMILDLIPDSFADNSSFAIDYQYFKIIASKGELNVIDKDTNESCKVRPSTWK